VARPRPVARPRRWHAPVGGAPPVVHPAAGGPGDHDRYR
jgi:hypothetical protein